MTGQTACSYYGYVSSYANVIETVGTEIGYYYLTDNLARVTSGGQYEVQESDDGIWYVEPFKAVYDLMFVNSDDSMITEAVTKLDSEGDLENFKFWVLSHGLDLGIVSFCIKYYYEDMDSEWSLEEYKEFW